MPFVPFLLHVCGIIWSLRTRQVCEQPHAPYRPIVQLHGWLSHLPAPLGGFELELAAHLLAGQLLEHRSFVRIAANRLILRRIALDGRCEQVRDQNIYSCQNMFRLWSYKSNQRNRILIDYFSSFKYASIHHFVFNVFVMFMLF